MKGIILAGGEGTRLRPVTLSISKQLLPIYDKPMIYYPLCALIMSDIRDIFIITTEGQQPFYKALLGDGHQWGLSIEYGIQSEPRGIADAFLVAEGFLDGDGCALVLGDNIFYGAGLSEQFVRAAKMNNGATVFVHHVNDPERYGVITFNGAGTAESIEEKPTNPKSNYAVTGLYFYNSSVVEIAKTLKPSRRGELEITDLNKRYMASGELRVEVLGRGVAWLDTGTHESLLQASNFVQALQVRQGLRICCPEEIVWQKGYIDAAQLKTLAESYSNQEYGRYLQALLEGQS